MLAFILWIFLLLKQDPGCQLRVFHRVIPCSAKQRWLCIGDGAVKPSLVQWAHALLCAMGQETCCSSHLRYHAQIIESYHRIIEWPELKRTTMIIEFQPFCYVQGCKPPDQAGCGSGQLGLVFGDPAHSRRGWNLMIIVVLFNPGHSMFLWFYDM